jgi:predicted ATPase
MRLDKLRILSGWKNLGGFEIDFDESSDITVLIGRNGSAKSNLFEALIRIFRDIDLGRRCLFSYVLEYYLDNQKVVVSGEADKPAKATVDGRPVSDDEFRTLCMPRYLVGYYSGTSDRFKELFYDHDRIALGQTLDFRNTRSSRLELRRFICARPVHGLFALLAFYFSDDEQIASFLSEVPRIESFDSVLIALRKPRWARKGSRPQEFWGASGPVKTLLESFMRYSLAPFSTTRRVRTGFRSRETQELLYLYIPDLVALRSVANEYGNDPRSFFQALDTMRLSDLIDDDSFKVRVRVRGVANAIHIRQLSEGEQQLLTVLGLMRFTANEESIYLLDEPDTHLNPAWGVEYLDRLRNISGIQKRSHTILATHDPLLVAGLKKEEIRVLYRSDEGKIGSAKPEESPRGHGVAGVLTSPLFGLESQLDPFSLRVLKRIYKVSDEPLTPKRDRHLRRLRRLVPALVPSESSPDPYRNIARIAYELAMDKVISGQEELDRKGLLAERLANELVKRVQ